MKKSVTILMVALCLATSARAIEVVSKQAYLIDTTTNTILFDKDAEALVPPSSMSKLMTALMVFQALKSGRITLKDLYTVSKKAWKMEGSRMFLNVNEQVSVSDLLRGLIIQSGNDAAVTLAEGLMGDEDAFAERMNQEAQKLGTTHSTFKNATGLPADGHLSTMKDLVLLAQKTIELYPEYYAMYSETEFTHNKIKQMNRNPLLYVNMGADGLKTGATDAAGYGVVASSVQNGRRLILAINGAPSKQKRADDAKALMAWGFSYFASPKILAKGESVGFLDVWLGKEGQVPMIVQEDVYVTLPRHQMQDLKMELVYTNPVAAPIAAGQKIGKVVITVPGRAPLEKSVFAGSAAERAGFFPRIKAAMNYLLWGHN
ncbi:MAG: D-alanyl-D-alanine carboxypeptidase [Alphaproteobacteria bacterium]|nr:D-alanyl-D-alanine carboxypeptidase [Alphaproteobacteria bacterium]